MFLRCSARKKEGKEHRYFSIVENKRVADGRVMQRHVLYLGEINSSQELAWRKSIEVFEDGQERARTLALFPADRCEAVIADESVVRVRLSELELCRPRQWGACWLVVKLWRELELDRFWSERLSPSRKGTRWDQVLLVLVAYRLIAPGSEWRLHREWFGRTALADLLGADFSLAESHKLYACHDLLLKHKQALFDHLVDRWRDLFNASFDVLLYDLTSTYFESDPPFAEGDKRQFGYSRDRRSDCVQVVIALIVYTMTVEKTRDIATLKILGAPDWRIGALVLQEALALGPVEQRVFGVAQVFDDQPDFTPQRVPFEIAEARQVELVDQLAMDPPLEVLEIALLRNDTLGGSLSLQSDTSVETVLLRNDSLGGGRLYTKDEAGLNTTLLGSSSTAGGFLYLYQSDGTTLGMDVDGDATGAGQRNCKDDRSVERSGIRVFPGFRVACVGEGEGLRRAGHGIRPRRRLRDRFARRCSELSDGTAAKSGAGSVSLQGREVCQAAKVASVFIHRSSSVLRFLRGESKGRPSQ